MKTNRLIVRKDSEVTSYHIDYNNIHEQDTFLKNLYEKNYKRVELSKAGNRPMILRGKFKRAWDGYITFTNIRPYVPGIHTKTICNHINILKDDAKKQIDIASMERNRTYYLIGRCVEYSNESGRYGFKLAMDIFEHTLFIVDNAKEYLTKDVEDACYTFDKDEYVRDKYRV